MDLIVWRHADAEEGLDDLARGLTRKGLQQAKQMALWLRLRLPKEYRILASEARRSQQTAAFLHARFDSVPELNPGAELDRVLHAIDWPTLMDTTTVLVGHQPYIGCLVAQLVADSDQCWSVKKGAIWWLSYREQQGMGQVRVKAMMTPALVSQDDVTE